MHSMIINVIKYAARYVIYQSGCILILEVSPCARTSKTDNLKFVNSQFGRLAGQYVIISAQMNLIFTFPISLVNSEANISPKFVFFT